MRPFLAVLLVALLSGGCSNYFSNYRTVYRIETTDGERFYSDSEPDLDKAKDTYEITDLDGNEYKIPADTIFQVEKYKHRK